MKVTLYRGKLYYPFTFEGDAAAALERAETVKHRPDGEEKRVPVFTPGGVKCQELRQGLGGLLSPEGGANAIARIYTLSRRETVDLPREGTGVELQCRSGVRAALKLGAVRFFLFETGVGFLELGVETEGLELGEVMDLTYFLAEVKDRTNRFEYALTDFDAATRQKTRRPVTLSVRELIDRCMAWLPGCGSFEDRDLSASILKPPLYSYYLLEGMDRESEGLFFNLALNYKASYKGAGDNRTHTLELFENSRWCASYNSAANVSWQVADEKTNDFFRTAFPGKWETEYLFLFVNTLHQKFSMLKYMAELSRLSCTRYDYQQMRDLLERGELLREQGELLKLRCFFRLPSHVEHINRLFTFLQQRFCIGQYRMGMEEGLKSLVGICEGYVEKIKKIEDLERELRGERREVLVALATAAVSCLAFFQSAWSTLGAIFTGAWAAVGLDGAVVTATFLTTVAAAAVNIVKRLGDMSELRGKIKKLRTQTFRLSGGAEGETT